MSTRRGGQERRCLEEFGLVFARDPPPFNEGVLSPLPLGVLQIYGFGLEKESGCIYKIQAKNPIPPLCGQECDDAHGNDYHQGAEEII